MPRPRRLVLPVSAFCLGVLLAGPVAVQQQAAETVWFSGFATEVNRVCAKGELGDDSEAARATAYCAGFLFAVISRLEMDGRICLDASGTIEPAIEEAARILDGARGRQLAWAVLEEELPKRLPCN